MAIIVEDGTGKADAQTYCTLAFANAWHLARGITLWAGMSDAEKEACLVRAAGYMVQAYRLRWQGYRVTQAQALDWPRYDVLRPDGSPYGYGAHVLHTVVPIEVQQANAELAFKAGFADLAPDVGRDAAVKRERVDVLEVEYADGAPVVTRYRSADLLLAPLLRDAGGGSMMPVARA